MVSISPENGRPVRAASYCRLSLAAMDDTTKVDDQDEINHRVASHRGWTIPDELVFKDNSRSAWRRDRKRPAWEQMLQAINRGEIDAIIVYHGDRLIRQPWDLELLLNVARERGIRLASPTGERNLDNPDDQFVLRIEAAQACRESDNLSRRQKNGIRRRREQGLVRSGGRGGRAFGFETDGVTHRQAEVILMRECADRILAGEGAGEIGRDWDARGLSTVTGANWNHGTIKKMMLRPRVVGLMPDGESKAAWEPILPRDRWEAVCAVLQGRASVFHYVTNARAHLLSGIVVCGPCGEPLSIRHHSRNKQMIGYGCITPGCRKTHRAQEYFDAYVIGHVLELLGNEGFISELEKPDDPGLAGEITGLEARKAEVEEQLRSLADHPSLRPDLLLASLASFDNRIAEIRDRIALSARRRLLLKYAGLDMAGWEALPLTTQRSLVQSSYRVTVWPVTKKGPGFDPNTIDMVPVDDES